MNTKDGFENFDNHIATSTPAQHFHQEMKNTNEKQFNYLVVQKLDVESPNLLHKFVVEPLQNAGQNALTKTKVAISQIPSYITWGAIGIFHKIQQAFQKEPGQEDNQKEQQQQQQQQQQKQEQEENLDQLPILFVVPKEVLDLPLKDRLSWIESHKEHYEVFIPDEKPKKLNTFNGSSSSSSSPSECPDCDVRLISQEFRSFISSTSDQFPSTISQQNLNTQSQKFMISQEDYQLISQQKNEQQLGQQQINNPQNILLYPLLGDVVPRDQLLDQIKKYQLAQSEVTIVQPNVQPLQSQQINEQQQQQQFVPLLINGQEFQQQTPQINTEQQNQIEKQEQQQEQIEKQQELLLEI